MSIASRVHIGYFDLGKTTGSTQILSCHFFGDQFICASLDSPPPWWPTLCGFHPPSARSQAVTRSRRSTLARFELVEKLWAGRSARSTAICYLLFAKRRLDPPLLRKICSLLSIARRQPGDGEFICGSFVVRVHSRLEKSSASTRFYSVCPARGY
jgi:hypothetical protein